VAPVAALPALPVLPAAVAPLAVEAASAASAPAIPKAGAAAAPQAPAASSAKAAALPGLQKLAAQTSSAKPGSAEAGAALDRNFDLSNAGSASDAASPVSGSESPRASGLAPSAPSARRAGVSRIERRLGSDGGAVNVKLIAIIGGVVLALAVAIGALVHHGQKQDAFWKGSKAAADIVSVERAKRAGDAEALFTLAREARARQAQEREQVADAKARHAETIGSQKVSEVETLAAFDGLAAARAELGANEVSKDAARRLGGKLPSDWQGKIGSLDAQAKSSGYEGAVARELDQLSAEVTKERAADGALQGDLRAFDDKVPGIAGGLLKEQSRAARAELSKFESEELNAESNLHASELSAVRGRVYARLASGSAEFKSHADRRDALSAAADGSLKSAVELAQGIDDNLRDMSRHLANKTAALKDADKLENEAAQLTHVAVYVQAKDAQGNPMVDGQGRPVQVLDHYEDQSQPKRDAARAKRDEARSEADQARGLAVSADRSAVALRTLIVALRRDGTLEKEGLSSALPSRVPDVRVYIGYDWYDIGSADLEFFLNQLTEEQANEVRSRFGGVVEPLKQARSELSSRSAAEGRWLDSRVSDELQREKSRDF
jgi:hypothetical protein